MGGGGLGGGEFLEAAAVVVLLDEGAGLGEFRVRVQAGPVLAPGGGILAARRKRSIDGH